METRTIEIETADGPMDLYEAVPDDPIGAVIVIQEAFGVNDHIQDVTRRFADERYHALAPHIFHRAGGGTASTPAPEYGRTAPYGDFSKVMPLLEGLSDDGLLMDVDAALAHLREAGWSPAQIGVVGFCMGGRVTFLVATSRALGAAVGFYGGGIVTARFPQFPPLIDSVGDLKTPWLGLFGDLDQSIPVEDVERIKAELEERAPVDHEVVRYPDAGHGFHCDQRPDFHPESAADGWNRTIEWLSRHAVGVA